MNVFKLNEDKQNLLKIFLGENIYNNLATYQKWILQFQLTQSDVDKFKKIEGMVKNGKVEFSHNTKCDEAAGV